MTQRNWLYLGLAFLVVWSIVVLRFNPRGNPPPTGPADYNWQLHDLDAKPVDFARYKGKTVFLNIWATWCPPCVREMPSIAALASNPKLKDVAFVCVSVDDAPEPIKQFLSGKDWPMTVLHAGQNPMPRVYQTDGIPATFLIGPDGIIASSEIGSTDWNDPKVVALLESLSGSGKATQ
jgi:thiol-disulfide isomerase/thioredoxin